MSDLFHMGLTKLGLFHLLEEEVAGEHACMKNSLKGIFDFYHRKAHKAHKEQGEEFSDECLDLLLYKFILSSALATQRIFGISDKAIEEWSDMHDDVEKRYHAKYASHSHKHGPAHHSSYTNPIASLVPSMPASSYMPSYSPTYK